MTVSTTTSRKDATGNGVTTLFTALFRILDQTHIQVLRTQISTGVVTTMALTTDYTVSGVGGDSFDVTFLVAPTTDQRISILRNVPFTQEVHYVENDPFPAATHEMALDQLTMEVQQLNETISRALVLSANTSGVSAALPSPTATNLIGWNNSASALQNYDAGSLGVAISYAGWIPKTFSGDGVTTAFVLATDAGNAANCDVSVNGVTQIAGVNFTYTAATKTLAFITGAPPVGTNNVYVRYGQALPQGTVDTANLSDGSVTTSKLAAAAVTAPKLVAALRGAMHGKCILTKSGANLLLSQRDGQTVVDGADNVLTVPSAGLTVAPTGASATTLYYVYTKDANADGVLDDLAISTTAPTTATNGIRHKTGDTASVLVGMAYVKTAATFADSSTQRFVRSWFNDPGVATTAPLGANTPLANTSYAEVASSIRNEIVLWAGETIQMQCSGTVSSNGSGNTVNTGIGVDATNNAEFGANRCYQPAANVGMPMACSSVRAGLSEGYHFVTMVGLTDAGTATWSGSPNAHGCNLSVYTKG